MSEEPAQQGQAATASHSGVDDDLISDANNPEFQVPVRLLSGDILFVTVTPKTKVREVKYSLAGLNDDLATDYQMFIYPGFSLDTNVPENMTMQELKITPDAVEQGAVLTVFMKQQPRKAIQVFIRNLRGKSVVADFCEAETVEDLEDSISAIEGVPIGSFCLIHQGRKLETARLVSEYNIPRDATLTMVLRPSHITESEHARRQNEQRVQAQLERLIPRERLRQVQFGGLALGPDEVQAQHALMQDAEEQHCQNQGRRGHGRERPQLPQHQVSGYPHAGQQNQDVTLTQRVLAGDEDAEAEAICILLREAGLDVRGQLNGDGTGRLNVDALVEEENAHLSAAERTFLRLLMLNRAHLLQNRRMRAQQLEAQQQQEQERNLQQTLPPQQQFSDEQSDQQPDQELNRSDEHDQFNQSNQPVLVDQEQPNQPGPSEAPPPLPPQDHQDHHAEQSQQETTIITTASATVQAAALPQQLNHQQKQR